MQELANKVWENPRFHKAARDVELAWLQKELGATTELPSIEASKLMSAAAILACSANEVHKRTAFRVATCAYELFGTTTLPLDQALRVVLARLGNFASFGTRADVESALEKMPAALAIEEVADGEARSVEIGGRTIYLTDFQRGLWNSLQQKERIALAAPTSAGKSFVLEGYLASLFSESAPCSVIYIVPTRALIAQVADDLAQKFKLINNAPEIITVPVDGETSLPQRAVYVMTQERAQILASTHPAFSANLIVVDEAHAIADGSRGVLLQWVIDDLIERNPTAQILFASPNVRNLDIFGRLFGLEDVRAVTSSEPTVAQNFLITKVEGATKGKIRVFTAGDGARTPEQVAMRELGHTLASRKEKLVHIAIALGAGQSNIVYANGAAEAEDIALQLAELLGDREITETRKSLSDLAREAVHANYALAECAKAGVAFHYSNIPTHLRRAIEEAVSAGEVDYLVCTSTLLQGVNLPAKNIFMLAPEKGRLHPLESTDFWNLSGRAGRLRREFQGNIFLIDYDDWKKKPLEGDRDAVVTPAIEANIKSSEQKLVEIIQDNSALQRTDAANLESTFVRLYADLNEGRLTTTLQRAGLDATGEQAVRLSEALTAAKDAITVPTQVIRNTPNISAHKQQRLYDELVNLIEGNADNVKALLPRHPREAESFATYSTILERCHRIILGIDTSKNLHRFHALMALRWMQGMSLPQIVQSQIDRNAKKAIRTTIRDTLDLIENQIRFQAIRLFGCYITLLKYALEQKELADLAASIPSIPLFLEVGASDKTMISFISLGLSRVTAMKLNDLAARKNMDTADALAWLKARPLESLGLSPLLIREVRAIMGQ